MVVLQGLNFVILFFFSPAVQCPCSLLHIREKCEDLPIRELSAKGTWRSSPMVLFDFLHGFGQVGLVSMSVICRCRGYFNINASLANSDGVFPDTYLNIGLSNWAKGVAFINGFNLVSYSSGLLCQETTDFHGKVSLDHRVCWRKTGSLNVQQIEEVTCSTTLATLASAPFRDTVCFSFRPF